MDEINIIAARISNGMASKIVDATKSVIDFSTTDMKLFIAPAFLIAGLVIYQAAEESVLLRIGARKSAAQIDEERHWLSEACRLWREGQEKAVEYYKNPMARLRLWLANTIAPGGDI